MVVDMQGNTILRSPPTERPAGRPRRRPVPRHPGLYFRPRRDGKVAPPYEFRFLDSTGRRRWEVVHGNLDAAEARRAELMLRRRRGERIEPTRQTFAEYAAEWLERQNVRPRTLEIHSWAIRQHLLPYFGRRRLDQINVEDIAAFIVQMQRKKLKGSTITTALRPLSIILAQAARKGRIPVNPMTQLERGERPRHDDQRPKRILNLEEMHALIRYAETEQNRCLIELMLTSGLRVGEALGLTITDLDPRHAVVRVSYQLGRDGTRTPLKTSESQRALDIPPELMRRLLALIAERGDQLHPNAFVFASRTGTGLERKTARTILKRAATAAALATPHPSLHDLRHSHASMLIALDYNVVDVQHRLGHRDPNTTLRVYTHEWKYRDAQRSQIGAHLGQLFNPSPPPALPPAPATREPLALPAGS
jgi:integrase